MIKQAKLSNIWLYQSLRKQENFILPNPWRNARQVRCRLVMGFKYAPNILRKAFSQKVSGRSEALIEYVFWSKYS